MIHFINRRSSKHTNLGLFLLFVFISSASSLVTEDCHYSCKKCLQPLYDRCVQCHQGNTYQQLVDSLVRQSETYRYIKYGLCQGSLTLPINALGIIALALYMVLYWFRKIYNKQSNVFLLMSWMQSLSMLSFVSLPFQQPLSYLLQSFTIFMPVTTLSKLYKLNQQTDSFIQDHQYRLKHFIMSENVEKNMIVLGPVICILIAYIGLIPLFLYLRKRFCGEDKCRKWSEKILKKIESLFYVLFFFIIQQTYLVLFVSLKMNPSRLAIILTVLFVLATIFMAVNYGIKPIQQFPNKKILFLHLLQKIGLPLMLVSSIDVYMIMAPSFLFTLRVIEARMNDKNYNMKSNEKNKYFGYLICVGIIIFLFGVYQVVEKVVKSSVGSIVVGIIVSLVVAVLYGGSLSGEGFEMWRDYRMKEQQEINAMNLMIREQVTTLTLTTEMNQFASRNHTFDDIRVQIKNQQGLFQSQQQTKDAHSNIQYQENLIDQNSTKRLQPLNTNLQIIQPPFTIHEVESSQVQPSEVQEVDSTLNNYQKTLTPKIESDFQPQQTQFQNNYQENIQACFYDSPNQSHQIQKPKKRKKKLRQTPLLHEKELFPPQLNQSIHHKIQGNKFSGELEISRCQTKPQFK